MYRHEAAGQNQVNTKVWTRRSQHNATSASAGQHRGAGWGAINFTTVYGSKLRLCIWYECKHTSIGIIVVLE
jgi:hypothetical protein